MQTAINAGVTAAAMTRLQAARYLAISTRTLDELASRGELRRGKIGSKTVFRRADLDHYLALLVGTDAETAGGR